MTALLQRLKNLTSDTPITQQQETGNRWVFRDELEKKGVDFFQPLVRIHPLLEFEYDIHRGHLFHSFASKAKESQKRKLTLDERAVLVEQLKAALAMAELLAHLYYYYLNVHCQKLGSLQDEQKYYRQVLSMMGHPIPAPTNLENEPTNSLSKLIKDPQSKYNWRRLFTIRIRRVFITLLPFLQNSQAFPNIINGVDRFLGPTLNYVAWVFYVPRLTVNLILLFKHLFPNQWTGMAEKEEELGWLVRLESQLQRRGLELGNDMAWFIGGILGCFLFIGGLAPIGWYVTVSIFFFDVILASIRAVVELSRMQKLREEYRGIAENKRSSGASPEELKEIEEYQKHLEERFSCKRQQVIWGIISTSTLFLGMCCALPIFAVNPVIPLVGAILVLTVTLAGFLAERWFKSQEAKMKEPESFFKNRNVMFPPLNPTESRLIAPSSHNSNDGFIDDECSYSVQ